MFISIESSVMRMLGWIKVLCALVFQLHRKVIYKEKLGYEAPYQP